MKDPAVVILALVALAGVGAAVYLATRPPPPPPPQSAGQKFLGGVGQALAVFGV